MIPGGNNVGSVLGGLGLFFLFLRGLLFFLRGVLFLVFRLVHKDFKLKRECVIRPINQN